MIDLYRNIKNFILNLIKYRRFLWNDHWYDSHYIFLMLREKLQNDLKMYKKHSLNARPEPIINSMELCVKILNRIIQDEYLQNALYFYEKKYPDWFNYTRKWLDDEEDLTFKFEVPDRKWFRRCSERTELQRQQDIDYLFRFMRKHLRRWWD